MKQVPKKLPSRWQRGFTMVELAIVLVVAGLILTAVLKGTDTVNKAKAERAVADLKGLQGLILEYQKRIGHLPGDCNNDGIIGYFPADSIYPGSANPLDALEADRALLKTALGTGDSATCINSGTLETEQNLVWNDLRRGNIVDPQRLPIELAKNGSTNSFYAVGNMIDTNTPANNANVIVVYAVPIWLAEAIDAQIDGVVAYTGTTSAANSGRIRRWDTNVKTTAGTSSVFTPAAGTFVNGFAKSTETRDTLISISYQFDANKLPD